MLCTFRWSLKSCEGQISLFVKIWPLRWCEEYPLNRCAVMMVWTSLGPNLLFRCDQSSGRYHSIYRNVNAYQVTFDFAKVTFYVYKSCNIFPNIKTFYTLQWVKQRIFKFKSNVKAYLVQNEGSSMCKYIIYCQSILN